MAVAVLGPFCVQIGGETAQKEQGWGDFFERKRPSLAGPRTASNPRSHLDHLQSPYVPLVLAGCVVQNNLNKSEWYM
jgi:hypothetical protein